MPPSRAHRTKRQTSLCTYLCKFCSLCYDECCCPPWYGVWCGWYLLVLYGFYILCFLLLWVVAYWITQNPHGLDLSQCSARVGDSRGILFQPDIYYSQFNITTWYSRNITVDEVLCGEGFEGNSDIYGLGIRVGIYLQWASCLLANHTLPNTRIDLAKDYLIFLIAIAVAVFVMSVQSTCNFALEIVILYYMFFGGYLCICTQPNLTTSKSKVKWLGMTWHNAILRVLYILMIGHSAWFWIHGYDKVFAKLPCGTHHFFFGKISDPGAIELNRLRTGTLRYMTRYSLL
jgi:hypothetical protein